MSEDAKVAADQMADDLSDYLDTKPQARFNEDSLAEWLVQRGWRKQRDTPSTQGS